jgi:ribosomal protein S18 acetylase RimI-like enzyme
VARTRSPTPIRLATPADAAALAELGARTFRDTYAADTRPEELERFVVAHFSHKVQAAELRDPAQRYLIAQVGGAAAGFALLRDGAGAPGVAGERTLRLAQLYVDRPHIRTGVGAALMRRCLELACAGSHDVLWLSVWERNTRAIDFYARWGFTHVGEMPFEFGRDRHRDLVLALNHPCARNSPKQMSPGGSAALPLGARIGCRGVSSPQTGKGDEP